MDYELIDGKEKKFIKLYCVKCAKDIIKLPLDCIVKPKSSIVLGNMSCALKGHEIKVVEVK
jgi:hypothetical protein